MYLVKNANHIDCRNTPSLEKEVLVFEDLKERIFSNEDYRITDKALYPLLTKSFSDPNFALMGAESNADCQNRAITVLKEILTTYQGRKVAIGTHGAVMAPVFLFRSTLLFFQPLLAWVILHV
ncbi:broad specificity phosphatase PhoE [Bacillus ectoiniformans]|nr:broad specificity phosphatase PhoE [Bacillus ectoiniformans]